MAQPKPKIVFWKPGTLVRGEQVYLDANFLVALAGPDHIWHRQATALQQSLAERQTGLVLSTLALNEAIYQLQRLAQKAPPARIENESGLQNWQDRLSEVVENMPNFRAFEPPGAAFHRQVIRAVSDLALDPTDAFHYAATRHLNCPIITNDAGFQKIADQNLTIVTYF